MKKLLYSLLVFLSTASTALICGPFDKVTDAVGGTVEKGAGMFAKFAFLAMLKNLIVKWGIIILLVIVAIILLVIIIKKLKKKK